ncbi:FecR domain-containing protein [Novosphingobium sp. 1949]|uniref:FecR domain-containing protein n=1 Tax=Novosphingobium organovorum TaxID=2930092 RepID=A0ABT0BCV6_9SPHN|nr:FecR domain-containing protein [Novosphingobium organovorum]MCJ2182905.1 FecR domain-containing protein [Novosphingobium organovorum]
MQQDAPTSLHRSEIEAEAARLYLAAQTSGDWTQAFAWIERDPAHGYAFAKVEASWDLSGRLEELALDPLIADTAPRAPGDALAQARPHGEAPEPANDRSDPARRGISRRTLAAAAASGVFAVTGALGLRHWMGRTIYETAIGETRQIDLADGSHIHLNTHSRVAVSFGARYRAVDLLMGEARFDIAHDARRPFVVDAGACSFRVLGTVFNIRFGHELTELTVLSGRVAVHGAGIAPIAVSARQYAAISDSRVGVTTLGEPELAQRTAWEHGIISFDGETLEQAVSELNRYRAKPLVIGAPQIAALRIGGTVRAADSQTFVETLQTSFGIRALDGAKSVLLMPGPDFTADGTPSPSARPVTAPASPGLSSPSLTPH